MPSSVNYRLADGFVATINTFSREPTASAMVALPYRVAAKRDARSYSLVAAFVFVLGLLLVLGTLGVFA